MKASELLTSQLQDLADAELRAIRQEDAIAQLTSGTQTIGSVQITSAGTTGSIGSVALLAGSSANTVGAAAQGAGSTTVSPWYVISSAGGGGSTTVDANLSSAGSTKVVGITVDNPYSSGLTSASTANSSADVAFWAANAARRAAMIQNASTGTALLVSFSTAAVTSGGAYTFQIPANGYVVIGGNGAGIPLYAGPIRGKMNSTAVAGPVFLTQFLSST